MQKLDLQSGKALVIVAHPDDETIWMGGTIKRHENIAWTIFVLCRESDPDRMPKFLNVSKFYNAHGIICDLEDEGIIQITESVPKIKSIIRKRLPGKNFDYIFTHGRHGDYGHPRHIGVHGAVRDMIKDKELAAGQYFYFAYMMDEERGIAVPNPKHDFYLKLSSKEFREKRNIIKKLYGFKQSSFENRSCAKIETFSL